MASDMKGPGKPSPTLFTCCTSTSPASVIFCIVSNSLKLKQRTNFKDRCVCKLSERYSNNATKREIFKLQTGSILKPLHQLSLMNHCSRKTSSSIL